MHLAYGNYSNIFVVIIIIIITIIIYGWGLKAAGKLKAQGQRKTDEMAYENQKQPQTNDKIR